MQRERAVLCRELGAGSRAVQGAGRRRKLGAGAVSCTELGGAAAGRVQGKLPCRGLRCADSRAV